MSAGVPADAATTKKNRVLDLIRFCQMMPDGASHQELVNYMWLQHGNTERKATEYVNKLISMGIFRPKGHKVVVDASSLAAWESVLGLTAPVVTVQCLGEGCTCQYSSNLAQCPECGSYDRRVVEPREAVING